MKSPISITLISAMLCNLTIAEIPQKTPLYTGLWTNSPFTSKPIADNSGSQASPLDNYILIGVAPVPGGHRITIADKKDITKRIVLEPGAESGFKVLKVNRNPGVPLGTTVSLSDGSVQGEIGFEPKLVKLSTPEPNPNPDAPPENPAIQPPVQNNTTPERKPRQRLVPSANPTNKPTR